MKNNPAKIELAKRELARRNLLSFTKYTMPEFRPAAVHLAYYDILNRFANGDIKKLIISMPPQHGKSEGSTRRLPSYILGKDPNKKVAICSYNQPFARKFNRDNQRIIDSQAYNNLFPNTTLNKSRFNEDAGNEMRSADEFEIVDSRGGVKVVGRGGALTGNPVDVAIMDDLYKDYSEGNSPIVLESAWDWYTSVLRTRLHNDSQQLIVFTRWNEEDLIGRLENTEIVKEIQSIQELKSIKPNEWVKINFEAIKTTNPTELDPREKGDPLWSERHSIEKLKEDRALDPEKFECLDQGNPIPKEGLMYDKFSTYSDLPEDHKGVYNYTDTADTGQDKLCSMNYILSKNKKAYVINILYTDKPMEYTEPATAKLLDEDNVSKARIESNNGGRGFARAVGKLLKGRSVISWFHQSKNKESRIFTASAGVQRDVYFPEDWASRWPEFYRDMTRYKKLFKANKHDDAPDTITGVYEVTSGKLKHKETVDNSANQYMAAFQGI